MAADGVRDRRHYPGGRSIGVRPSIGGADRRCHRRSWRLHRPVRQPARRLWPASKVRAGANLQDSCVMHGFPGTDTIVEEGRTHRSRRRAARLHRPAQCAGRHERRGQRQCRDRRVGNGRRHGLRQGGLRGAAAHARCRRPGQAGAHADRAGACLEGGGDAKLPGARAAQSCDDVCDVASHRARGRPQAYPWSANCCRCPCSRQRRNCGEDGEPAGFCSDEAHTAGPPHHDDYAQASAPTTCNRPTDAGRTSGRKRWCCSSPRALAVPAVLCARASVPAGIRLGRWALAVVAHPLHVGIRRVLPYRTLAAAVSVSVVVILLVVPLCSSPTS